MDMDILSLLLTLLVASLGAFVFTKIKVPAGAFLGAMLFVAFFNGLTDAAFIPVASTPYIRIFSGALIGSRMKKSDVIEMRTIVFPAVLLVFGMLILNLSLGYGIFRLTGLDLMTALLGSAPGGIQDMALIADALGAESAQIALLQTVRLLAVLSIHPVLLRAYVKRRSRRNPKPDIQPGEAVITGSLKGAPAPRTKLSVRENLRVNLPSFALTVVFAAAGGFLLNMTPLPAGSMVGAMLATVIMTIFLKPAYVPNKVRAIVMTCAGALIGSGIGADKLVQLKEIIVPAIILVLVLLAANFIFGILIHKITKLDLTTAMFGSAAGGLTDMALIADALGADSPKVAVLQLLRLICVITLFPTVIKLFSTFV